MQRVPNSTMAHVSPGPPFHPGRSDFPSPVGDHGLSLHGLPLYSGSLSADSHTPLTVKVHCEARDVEFVYHLHQAQRPEMVSSHHRHVPRAPLPARRCYPLQCDVSHHIRGRYPSFFALTGSCARPNPSCRLRFPCLSRPLQVVVSPCWEMTLPGVISAILV
jgi:hypothetical protein